MPTTYPLQIIAGKGQGVSQSSEALIGALMPVSGFTQAGLRLYYNVSNKNSTLLEAAGNFPHSSGVETLGYAFNSKAGTRWSFRIPFLSKAPDGTSASLQTADGATINFSKSGDVYYAEDFGIGRSVLEYDSSGKSWIHYDPTTQLRHVYSSKGQLVAKYGDGMDITNYSYDSKGRITKITPPGLVKTNRFYSISYAENLDGTETQTILVSDSGKVTTLRDYHFSKDKLIDKITVHAQGSDPSTDTDMPYIVNLAYKNVGSVGWELVSITSDNDASSLFCIYEADTTLREVQLGVDTPYAIGLDSSQQSKGITKVGVTSGMGFDITQNSDGLITQVARYTGYDSVGIPDLTQYQYDQSRVEKKTAPDGSAIDWEYDTSNSISHGLVTKQTHCGQSIVTAYEVFQNRVYQSAVTADYGIGVYPHTTYFLHKVVGQHEYYPQDCCVGLVYTVSHDGRVVGYDVDPLSALPSYKRTFPAECYTDGDVSVVKLDAWATTQYKNKAFTIIELQRIAGSTLLSSVGHYSKLTDDGFAIPDNQYELNYRYYDTLMRKNRTYNTLCYKKNSSGTPMPVMHNMYYGYDSFGRLAGAHYQEDQINELGFLSAPKSQYPGLGHSINHRFSIQQECPSIYD